MKTLYTSFLKLIFVCAFLFSLFPSMVKAEENDGFPDFFIRGELNGWGGIEEQYKFSRNGNEYFFHMESLNGQFKIGNADWTLNYGGALTAGEFFPIHGSMYVDGIPNGVNFFANDLRNVDISFSYTPGIHRETYIKIMVGGDIPDIPDVRNQCSGTLPVLYINVYDMEGNFDNEIISKDLSHKNYFKGEYWLDMNDCEWLAEEGGVSIGSKEEPLPLEIKARGNYTRKGFSKKPFKLKLGKKQTLLGMSKSKHYAILAHADDFFGYMRNFTGFSLGKRIELPWTPSQQPIEVVINGDYRGLYFLTESIRVEDGRINIQELEDNTIEPSLISGGYLVELDNYEEENQIRMTEKGQAWAQYRDELRITFDTPEIYSDIQRQFVSDQFTAMNDAIGDNSDRLWSYMDLDDAARYYIVEEILSHTESYHGSTYLFRDRGEGQKWHFSPLWDCGNAFMGMTDSYFTENAPFGNTWIASLRLNEKFMNKVKETWKWFMSQKFDGLYEELDIYSGHLKEAAEADYKRWNNQPLPDFESATPVVDNRNMDERLGNVKNHLQSKITWLSDKWGDYQNGYFEEPDRDDTEAAALPEYITTVSEEIISPDCDGMSVEIYDLTGMKVSNLKKGEVYIVRKGGNVKKILTH